ncbi:hypothetical protein U1Q18_007293, partial [Sarracenia purpurea var. burkii]
MPNFGLLNPLLVASYQKSELISLQFSTISNRKLEVAADSVDVVLRCYLWPTAHRRRPSRLSPLAAIAYRNAANRRLVVASLSGAKRRLAGSCCNGLLVLTPKCLLVANLPLTAVSLRLR